MDDQNISSSLYAYLTLFCIILIIHTKMISIFHTLRITMRKQYGMSFLLVFSRGFILSLRMCAIIKLIKYKQINQPTHMYTQHMFNTCSIFYFDLGMAYILPQLLTLIAHTNPVHLYPLPINISTVNVRITKLTVISARSLAELKNLSMLSDTSHTMPISTVVVAVAISQACDWIKC